MHFRAAYGRFLAHLLALLSVIAVATLFSMLRDVLDSTVVALLLLIPVGSVTGRWGLGPGITAALTAFLAFNFLFIPPYYTFIVHNPGDLGVLLVFLVVAVVMGQLVARAQAAARDAVARERESTQLYELSTALAGSRDNEKIALALGERLRASLDCQYVEVGLTELEGALGVGSPGVVTPTSAPDLTTPVRGIRGVLGEIRLWRHSPPISSAEERIARTFAGQGALALERAALSQAEDRARLLEESDRFKSSLLSSVSHDLRTPLATIKAAASSLRAGEVRWDSPAGVELLAAIDDETDSLNMLVGNLLDMSRIESGALRPQRRWNVLREIVQTVANRMRRMLEEHRLVLDVPEDLPLVPVDFVQIGQVFTNLISNSVKFAPRGTVVRVHARMQDPGQVLVEVSNEGPPVPESHLEAIFDRFHQMPEGDRSRGTGLGLSICKAIVEAHAGTIRAENVPGGFAFKFTLPVHMDGAGPQQLPAESA